MDGILPASGSASRMRGLPKFLLPCDNNYLTLLENHIIRMLDYCETIWIPTRPDLVLLVDSLKVSSERVILIPLTSQSMTETILKTVNVAGALEYMMCMPDTYFQDAQPYEYLSNLGQIDLKLATWKIRPDQYGKLGQVAFDPKAKHLVIHSMDKDSNCKYEHSWGAMSFKKDLLKLAHQEMPHLGYLINPVIDAGYRVEGEKIEGKYFDCGTPSEYLSMLKVAANE